MRKESDKFGKDDLVIAIGLIVGITIGSLLIVYL